MERIPLTEKEKIKKRYFQEFLAVHDYGVPLARVHPAQQNIIMGHSLNYLTHMIISPILDDE